MVPGPPMITLSMLFLGGIGYLLQSWATMHGSWLKPFGLHWWAEIFNCPTSQLTPECSLPMAQAKYSWSSTNTHWSTTSTSSQSIIPPCPVSNYVFFGYEGGLGKLLTWVKSDGMKHAETVCHCFNAGQVQLSPELNFWHKWYQLYISSIAIG